MKDRLCIHCEYCYLDGGFGGSEVTPAESATWSCTKGHFDGYLKWENNLPAFVADIYKAEKCPDFELSELGERLGVK